MKLRNKIFLGLAGLVALAGVAIAQVPALFVTSLTGTEQINISVPSTGTQTFSPQILTVTTKTLASYVNSQVPGVNAQTGTSYTIVASDLGKFLTMNNASAIAVTLPQATAAAGYPVGSTFTLADLGAGAATLTPTTSTINGAATFVVNQNRSATIFSDGTNWQADTGGSGLQVTPATIAEGGTGSATAAGARTGLGVNGITGGVAAAGGFTASPRNIPTCGTGYNGATAAFSAQTPVITEVYISEVYVPSNVTVTGVTMFNSATISGNVKVGLANSSGAVVATSASTAQTGTSTIQLVPFTGTYAAVGPATYYVLTFFDNTTTRPWAHTLGSCGAAKQTGQTYATGFTTITAPTTFTTALGTVATLY